MYFGNLLFEGNELERVRSAHGLDRGDVAGLLFHLGADCPGAISVTPSGTGPGKRPGIFPEDYVEIDSLKLAEIVKSLHYSGKLPQNIKDSSPVAGVQPKIALVEYRDRYFVPAQGTRAPTTHILKVSPKDDPSLAKYESALLWLAERVGLKVADHMACRDHSGPDFKEVPYIVSRRFDRKFQNDRITRVHTEDFCQALGLDQRLKYEREAENDDRKFCLESVRRIADQTAVPGIFRQNFLRQTLFNHFVGNTDNHGKNASVLYDDTRGVLAPLYDVVPVVMDRTVTHQFAFSLSGANWAEDLTPDHLAQAMKAL